MLEKNKSKNINKSIVKTKKNLNIDKYIGNRIKLRRCSLGITQKKLSSYLGITFQQIQKYENDKNRISTGSLFLISKFLSTDISYFFEGFRDTCNGNHRYKSYFYIDANDKLLHSFIKLYSHQNNPISKKLMLETSKQILKFFREERL